MDKDDFPIKTEKPGTQEIKQEIFDAKEDPSSPEEQPRVYIKEEIKIEDTALDSWTTEIKRNISDVKSSEEATLEQHISAHHQSLSNREEVKLPESEQHQLKEQIQSDERKFKCTQANCFKTYKTKCHLQEHVRSHSGHRPFKCQQADCSKAFLRKYDLTLHEIVHSDARTFNCPEPDCSKSFKRKDVLGQHLKVHNSQRPYKCLEIGCTLSFKRKYELNNHKLVHSDVRPYQCAHQGCSKTFKRKIELKQHRGAHGDGRRFKCEKPGCLKSFKWLKYLIKHVKTHKCDVDLDESEILPHDTKFRTDFVDISSSTNVNFIKSTRDMDSSISISPYKSEFSDPLDTSTEEIYAKPIM